MPRNMGEHFAFMHLGVEVTMFAAYNKALFG